jgi:long-chain acyl-CoA synthetase
MRGPAIEGTMRWDDFWARGNAVPEAEVDARLEALRPEHLATLIYTSGTTGPPKAVMLSHHNLAWTSRVLQELTDMQGDGRTLSYLPLSHIAEQMATIHGPISAGSAVYFAESVEKVADHLKEVRPTLFFGVPRIWEKFHAAIEGKLREAKGAKARLVAWTRGVGSRVSELRCRGLEPTGLLATQYRLAHRLVFSKLKRAIGLDQARTLVSGAAPIAKEVLEFFASLDLLIQEIYGQSEDSGPTTFNLRGRTRFGSVGVPLPGVEVKIAEDGEILVKGPNVFLGYFKDEAATRETLDADGWLHSGDLGRFDEQGFLHITGRKKEIIITAGGKNIAPKNIENAVKEHPLVAECVVIGDRRKYLTMLVTLDPEAAKQFVSERGGRGEPHTHPEIRAEIQRHLDAVNAKLARVEQVKKFTILDRPFSIETGELTPTLKVKRNVVAKNFAKEIEAMYADDRA